MQRPDLWAAVVLRAPVVNTMRIAASPGGVANMAEFGSPDTEAGFRALHLLDAYGKIQDGVGYPAVLLTMGLSDPRVDVWGAM